MEPIRHRERWTLFYIFLTTALVRLLMNNLIHVPAIFTDEYQYVEMARSFAKGQGMRWDGFQTYFPCWLYPMLISPFLKHFEWDRAYALIRGMNAFLMALTVFPAYALGRELGDRRRALWAAALVALVPGMGYSSKLMTESLFLPVFTLGMWLIFRAVMRPTAGRTLLAGLVCGLSFHIKPHGLLMPVMAGLTALIFEANRQYLRQKDAGRSGRGFWPDYTLAVIRHWLMAVGWLIGFSPRIWIIKHFEYPGAPFKLSYLLGGYMDTAAGIKHVAFYMIILSFLGYVLAWTWMLGVLPAVNLGRGLLKTIRGRNREDEAGRLMTILTTVATFCMLWLVARHTILTNPMWKIHERYFFVVMPLTLILFCLRGEAAGEERPAKHPGRLGRTLRLAVWSGLVVGLSVSACLVANRLRWQAPTDSPSLSSYALFFWPGRVARAFVVLYGILGVLAVGNIALRPRGARRQWLAIALLLVFFDIGYGIMCRVQDIGKLEQRLVARTVDRILKRDDQLMIVMDGMDRELTFQAGIRNAGPGLFCVEAGHSWWAQRLRLTPDGHVISPYPAKQSYLLAGIGWKFKQPPVRVFDGLKYARCSLYYLGGKEGLQLDSAQVAMVKAGQVPPEPKPPAPNLRQLKLSYLKQNIPGAFTVGKSATIKLRLRNDSRFDLPGKKLRLALGYRWLRPQAKTAAAQDAGTSATHDNSPSAMLPVGVPHGGKFDVQLKVIGPPEPGEQWVLKILPFINNAKGRNWRAGRQVGLSLPVKVQP